MRSFFIAFLLYFGILPTTLAVAADKQDDISGTWSLERYFVDGQQNQSEWGATYEFSGKTLIVRAKLRTTENEEVTTKREGTFALDPEKTPAEVDLSFNDKDGRVVDRGIYTYRKDRLHIWCFTRGGGRPTQKDMAGGEGISELFLKRTRGK
jgi:uncharacterized protein (TIGR03067 family)